LLGWLDSMHQQSDEEGKRRLAVNFSRELLRRRSAAEDQLRESLAAIGWQFLDGDLVPLEVLSPEDLASVPAASHHDLLKAAKRLCMILVAQWALPAEPSIDLRNRYMLCTRWVAPWNTRSSRD